MAKKEKKPKTDEAEADKPAKGGAEAAEGAEGEAPAKMKMAGKTLVLFIILPAVLVLGGGGAAAMMLLGGKPAAAAEAGKKPASKKKPDEKKKEGEGKEGGKSGAKIEDGVKLGTLTVGEDGAPSYYTMPKLIVNLAGSAAGDRQLLLELELVLESSDPASFDEMPKMMPRVTDQFQSFLRELRTEDLDGSAGSYRLRLELLKRFNAVMAPAKIDAVLIQGILVQ